MQKVLGTLFRFMPFLFGIGFVAPVIAQSIAALGWTLPYGASPVAFGLVVGGAWGAFANWSGRWI